MIKKVVAGITIFLIVFLSVLYFFGSRSIENLTRELLEQQSIVQGKVTAEKIHASWNGKVNLVNVTWNDAKSKTSANIPSAELGINIFDAILNGITEASVSEITLYEPEFFYEEKQAEKLNLQGNLDNSLKILTRQQFNGTGAIVDGKMTLKIAEQEHVLEHINASINLKDDTAQSGNAIAKYNGADLVLDLQTAADTSKIIFRGSNIPFSSLVAAADKQGFYLDSGSLNLNVNIAKFGSKEDVSVDGSFNEAGGSLYHLPLSKTTGAFHGDLNSISLTSMQLLLAEQPVNLHGNLDFLHQPTEKIKCDLNFNSGQFALNAVSAGINITEGVTVQGKLTGDIDNPILEGNFGIKTLDFAPLKIDDLHGSFLYFADKLNIANAVGNVGDGIIKADGELILKDGQFKFNLAAENIAADVLTANEVSGICALDAMVLGRNEPDSAVALGNFTIEDGKYKKIPFSKITGLVQYSNAGYRFSDISLHTFLGKIPLDAIVLNDGKVRFRG